MNEDNDTQQVTQTTARDAKCGDGCPFWELIVIESNKGYCIFCGEKCYKGDVCKAIDRKAIKRTLQ